MQSELPWTRNLIISSPFGPRLSESEFQGSIPPFRDFAANLGISHNAIGDRRRTKR